MKVGDICFIVISNYKVEEVIILKIQSNFYTVKFTNSDKVTRLDKHRIYESYLDAESKIPENKRVKTGNHNRPPMMH